MKKILFSVMTLVLVLGLVGAGSFAYFNDTETSEDNTFTAGTLDLKVDGKDDANIRHVTLSNRKPGDVTPGDTSAGYYRWVIKNVGTIPGQPSVEFSVIANYENGQNEPEALVDPTAGALEGELGQYFRFTIGWGSGWSQPSNGYYQSQIGPGKGLDSLGGKTYGYAGATGPGNFTAFPVLGQGEEIVFFMKMRLDTAVGNIIQSDSVEFDIIFHLDQVTP